MTGPERPARPRTIFTALRRAAQAHGDRAFVATPREALRYAETLARVQGAAAALGGRGVVPGDRVAIMLPNGLPFVVAVLAVIDAGGIAVPLDPKLRGDGLARVLRDCEPRLLVATAEAAARVEVLELERRPAVVVAEGAQRADGLGSAAAGERGQEEPDPDAVVTISYTSGTTGAPKGVMHSHRSWLAGAAFTADYFELGPESSILAPFPLHHGYAFRHLLAWLLAGGRVVATDGLLEALECLESLRPAGLLLVPDACRILLRDFRDKLARCAPFLRLVSVGTAALGDNQLQQLRQLLPRAEFHLPYGLTEARVGFLEVAGDSGARRLCTTAPGLEVRVVDGQGDDVAPGGTGEIVIRGEGLMVGYWGAPESQRRALARQGFRSGDRAHVSGQGEIVLAGRVDDTLKVGGRKVHPLEVESVLDGHPCVVESAVMLATDPTGAAEARLEALVVARAGSPPDDMDLLEHCRTQLEPYKVPAAVRFVDHLPRTATGKILRTLPIDQDAGRG